MAVLRSCFSSAARRQKRRTGRAGSSSACFVAASYASAGTSPTVGLPSAHRDLLGLRRLHAGGAKTCELQGRCCGSLFFRRKAAEEKNGPGRIVERMLCSCKLRLRRDEPEGRLTQRPSSSSWPPSASCRRGQDLQLQRPCCGAVFLPPQGGRREEWAGADRTNGHVDLAPART